MEYQKITNLLDNTTNRAKFRTKNQAVINDDARKFYKTESQIKFKFTAANSSLYDCSNAYILINPIQDGPFWGCSLV